jgi:lactoylglutathione lyase
MRIEHVAIWTADLERLRAFYERHLGVRAGDHYENATTGFSSYFLELEEGGARLELMSMPSIPETRDDPIAQATGIAHIAFALGSESAVDALVRRLEADGHRIVDGPRRTGDGYYEAAALDPDGNRIELTA